jgi:hypothetical protein
MHETPSPFAESTTPPSADRALPGAGDQESLRRLGGESETERAVKRTVPWVVSIGVHLGVIVLGFFITWSVVMLQREEEPIQIVADFDAMTYQPLKRLDPQMTEASERVIEDRAPIEPYEDRIRDQLELELDPIGMLSGDEARDALREFAPSGGNLAASFVGVSSTNARRIVYVIDASGSMLPYFQTVIDELARSLEGLTRQQSFGIVFFQEDRAIVVPPHGRLVAATADGRNRALSWIRDNVIPNQGTNPLVAIEAALRLDPDVIFLLSQNITGYGRFEIDQQRLFDLLDQLDPADPDSGRRSTIINCVQFLDADPLGTMQRIAERYGGPNGYKFLDRDEWGLKRR